MVSVRARVSSAPRAGVPAPRAVSKPPIFISVSRRKAILPPAPNGGLGYNRLCGPWREKVGGFKPGPLPFPAKLLEQALRLSAQAGRQDQPCHAAHITAAREAARQGGQPEDVRLFVVIEECHDVT